MKITVHNVETGEVITREMNETELSRLAKANADLEARVVAENEVALEKAALLAKLGITDDEAKLLLS
jgi:hypothetical protein